MNWKKINNSGTMHNFETTPELEGRFDSMIPANPTARKSSIITLLDGEGNEVKLFGCTILDNCFENIAQGEMVRIVYNGKKKGKSGAEYKDFDVFTEDKEKDDAVEQILEEDMNC